MRDELKIRKAIMKDIPDLIAIVRGVKSIEDYPGEYNRNYFIKMLKGHFVLSAELNGKILGFAEFEMDKHAKRVFLESIAIAKEFRGRGIASKLLEEVELFAKNKGLKLISMLVRDWNTDMNYLVKKKKYRKSDNFYLWEKRLS